MDEDLSPTYAIHSPRTEARATPSPTRCSPNQVVVHLSTTILIADYDRFWEPTPIASFRPIFNTLDDGSLVTTPFNQDLYDANLTLLVTGALAIVFIRNIIVSADYLRRGKVKKKTLFYMLFLSQVLAPISFVPIILSYFTQLHCTAVVMLSYVSGTISLALLITGILGIKAYKCLNNPRIVLIVLVLFQCASTAVVGIDITATQGARRLTGSCVRTDDLRYTRYFVTIQFLESLFIWCCFLRACRNSRGVPAVRGRISVQLSMADLPIDIQNHPIQNRDQSVGRGWWDYVPTSEKGSTSTSSKDTYHRKSAIGRLKDKVSRGIQQCKCGFKELCRSVSKRVHLPSWNSRKPSFVKISENTGDGRMEPFTDSSRNSLTPSGTRLSRLIPRMELFGKVMTDELFYVTFITATCVIVAILVLIGVNSKNGLSIIGWIGLNWGIISALAIHSFGRVVRRHEREELLQTSGLSTRARSRETTISVSRIFPSNNLRRQADSEPVNIHDFIYEGITEITQKDDDDPFSDMQQVDNNSSE